MKKTIERTDYSQEHSISENECKEIQKALGQRWQNSKISGQSRDEIDRVLLLESDGLTREAAIAKVKSEKQARPQSSSEKEEQEIDLGTEASSLAISLNNVGVAVGRAGGVAFNNGLNQTLAREIGNSLNRACCELKGLSGNLTACVVVEKEERRSLPESKGLAGFISGI